MNIDQMTIEDFIEIMAQNAEIYPEFDALPDEQKRLIANGNIVTGTAETFREDDGTIYGVGGIRHNGIGECWFINPPEARRHPKKLLRVVRATFDRIREEKQLWRVFAESKISETFLKHCSFKPEPGTYVWTIDGRPNGNER